MELTGTATTTVNADLRVGNLQETVTVTGETPIVDVQSSTRNAVLNKDIIDALPTSRNAFALGVLIPGMNVRNGFGPVTDVGGATGPDTLALSIHGGKTEDQRLLVNGVALSTMIGGGWGGGAIPNMSGQSEIAYDYSAVDAHDLDRRCAHQLHPARRRQPVLGNHCRQHRDRRDAARHLQDITRGSTYIPGLPREHREAER